MFRKLGLNHLVSLEVARFFYRFHGACLILGAPNPFTTRTIVDLLSDRAGTADVLLRSIFAFPLYLLTESLAALAGRQPR